MLQTYKNVLVDGVTSKGGRCVTYVVNKEEANRKRGQMNLIVTSK